MDVAQRQLAFEGSQRWYRGSHRWKLAGDLVATNRLEVVELTSDAVARAFVSEHHYSKSYPAARLRYGLVDTRADRLLGVCVLGVPMQQKVLSKVFPALEPSATAELSRLVLLDDPVAGFNAESWMVSRVFKMAALKGLRGIVAFSDPVPRVRLDGSTILVGHVGTIYKALGAAYLGRSTSRTLLLLPDGTAVSARSLSKVRSQERGHEYAERQLVAFGARPKSPGEDPRAWLSAALEAAQVRRIPHPGNHRYAFAVGAKAERRWVVIEGERFAYPAASDAVAA